MDHSITLRIEALGTRVESIEEFQASYYAREYAHAFQVLKILFLRGIAGRKMLVEEGQKARFSILSPLSEVGGQEKLRLCVLLLMLSKSMVLTYRLENRIIIMDIYLMMRILSTNVGLRV